MSDISSLIEKVAKLRALANGNPNENEAEAARAAADKIIQAHRISQAEIEAATGVISNDDPFVCLPIHEGGRRTLWREQLLWGLATHYGFAWYYKNTRKTVVVQKGARAGTYKQERTLTYMVVARKSDYEIAHFMFHWICDQLESLSRWHNGGKGVAAGKSWFDGAAVGVRTQFDRLNAAMRSQAASSNSSAAMVLLSRPDAAKKEMEQRIPHMTKGAKITGTQADMRSYYNGYDVGQKLELVKPLTGNAGNKPNALSEG
jgi:hypothetical protein